MHNKNTLHLWMVIPAPKLAGTSLTGRRISSTVATAVTFGFAAIAATADAQATSTPLDNIAFREQRLNAALGTGYGSLTSARAFTALDGAAGGGASYSLNAILPVDYNSNAEMVLQNGTSTVEGTPEIRFSWKAPVGTEGVIFTGYLDGSVDRFASSNGADGDSLVGAFRFQRNTGKNDQEWQPYIQYKVVNSFSPFFSSPAATSNQVTIGFDEAFNFFQNGDRIGVPLPVIDSTNGTYWSVGLSGYVGRTFVPSSVSYDSVFLAPSLTCNISNTRNDNNSAAQVSASVELDISRRWYDASAGFSQHAWSLTPIFTFEFDPPLSWFGSGLQEKPEKVYQNIGRPRFVFQAAYVKNYSNLSTSEFSQWAVGPSIHASWKF